MAEALRINLIRRRLAWLSLVLGAFVVIYAATPDWLQHRIYLFAAAPIAQMVLVAYRSKGPWCYRLDEVGIALTGPRRGAGPVRWAMIWKTTMAPAVRLGAWRGLPSVELYKNNKLAYTIVYDPRDQPVVVDTLMPWLICRQGVFSGEPGV
jgi:hypothetical protein